MYRLIYCIVLSLTISCTTVDKADLHQDLEKKYLKFDYINVIETTHGNIIKWVIEDEGSVLDYMVEKSTDGENFKVIGTVVSKGGPYSNVEYSFIDPDNNGYGYYRVILRDKYGYTKYSHVTVIKSLIDLMEDGPILKH